MLECVKGQAVKVEEEKKQEEIHRFIFQLKLQVVLLIVAKTVCPFYTSFLAS